MTVDLIIRLLTVFAFLGYGITCLFSQGMVHEFQRFGVPRFRILIGITQLLGALALLLGPWIPFLGLVGAFGLALQMLAGIYIRFRIGDTLLQASQALGFLGVTIYLGVRFWMSL